MFAIPLPAAWHVAQGSRSLILCLVRPVTSLGPKTLLLWISRVSLVLSAIALLLVYPLCHCPRYYLVLSAAGLIPLFCGPRLYRWSGGAFIVVALLFAVGEHRAAFQQTAEVERIRAEAQSQNP